MRYRHRTYPTHAEAYLHPVDALSIGGIGENAADAMEHAAAALEALGTSPLAAAVPQLAAAGASARLLRKAIAAAKAGEADKVLSTLSDKARSAVTSVLRSIF